MLGTGLVSQREGVPREAAGIVPHPACSPICSSRGGTWCRQGLSSLPWRGNVLLTLFPSVPRPWPGLYHLTNTAVCASGRAWPTRSAWFSWPAEAQIQYFKEASARSIRAQIPKGPTMRWGKGLRPQCLLTSMWPAWRERLGTINFFHPLEQLEQSL